ncbi:PAS domain-containing protein [Pseudomonas benzenivorans]|uniref:PAS domain-containing protein n=1 Tax=Pseudomonas benzenivorans TaxID=556533 RepID=UPI003516FCB7
MGPIRANPLRALDWRWVFGALLLWGGLVSLVTGVAGRAEREHMLALLNYGLQSSSQLRLESLARQVDRRRHQVRLLAKLPPVFGLARASRNQGFDALEQISQEAWQRRLESIFSAFATTTPNVLQVSLIGVADGGRELARIVQRGGRVQVLDPSQLQRRGDSTYFREAVRLRNNEVFVSDIEQEPGSAEQQSSAVLTMRVAAPVIGDDGALFAIVLVELDASRLLASLRASPDERQLRVYVSTRDGDFLLHPDSGSGMAGSARTRRWQDEFRGADAPGERMQPVVLAPGTGAYAISRRMALNPGTGDERDLTLTLAMADTVVTAAVTRARWTAGLALLGGGLLVALLAIALHWQRRALHRSRTELAAIVAGSRDAIIGSSPDGLVTSWNPAAERLFGYPAEEAIGQRLAELIVPQAQVDEDRMLHLRVLGGEALPGVERMRRRQDGSLLSVSLTVSPLVDPSGDVVGLADTIRAIGAQPQAQAPAQALQTVHGHPAQEQVAGSAALAQAILAEAGHAVVATDLEGVVTLCNPAAERLLGYAAEELIGRQTPLWHDSQEVAQRAEVVSGELRQAPAPGLATLLGKSRRNLPNQQQWTLIRKDGSRVLVLLTITALRGEGGPSRASSSRPWTSRGKCRAGASRRQPRTARPGPPSPPLSRQPRRRTWAGRPGPAQTPAQGRGNWPGCACCWSRTIPPINWWPRRCWSAPGPRWRSPATARPGSTRSNMPRRPSMRC